MYFMIVANESLMQETTMQTELLNGECGACEQLQKQLCMNMVVAKT